MDKGGFFLVYRGVFPDFGDAPYTEREAWLWLIASAGYEDTDMGQINTTYSELAKAWRWTYGGKDKRPNSNKSRRFLDKMAQQGRITFCNNVSVNSSQTCNKPVTREICVNICNYAKYQRKENGSVTTLSQPCNNEKLVCNNDPCFSQSSQVDTSPKQKNKTNKQEQEDKIMVGQVHPKPDSPIQPDPPIKTKAQIKREKAEAKKANREQLLVDIKNNFPSYKQQYPEVNIELEYEKMVVWLHSSSKGKVRTELHDVWANWLRTAQTRVDMYKLTYNNRKTPHKDDSLESFTEEVRRESQKLKQINERFTK